MMNVVHGLIEFIRRIQLELRVTKGENAKEKTMRTLKKIRDKLKGYNGVC